MGKKTKKTRWRALTLNGHQSDSEDDSNPPLALLHQNHRNYHKHHNSKFTYSSQSTPIRKYQNDSSKTTRSNSTTSEHKTTFNEDEYTRITTPRQDVLFKKGYLNKPKTYQTQTSTGTSSTANSTSTCTPDHQSADGTDLEYESQFVFPNGFIDHNGIYYINSYEPFPFVVYNAPVCYPEYPLDRTKRYSTDSAGDSASIDNEEVVLNGDDCEPASTECINGHTSAGECIRTIKDNIGNEEPRRLKKKRRRKISHAKTEDECESSCDTDASDVANRQKSPSVNGLHLNATPESSQAHEADNKTQLLKPDAQEFVPRTYQPPLPSEIPYEYVNFAPGYISIPYINHNPTFLPPGIPLNYVPIQEHKYVNHVTTKTPPLQPEKVPEIATQTEPLPEQIMPNKKPSNQAVDEQNNKRVLNQIGRYQKLYREKVKTQQPNVKSIDNKSCKRYQKTFEKQPVNQWISVSSRKKKRKGINEQTDDFENVCTNEPAAEELFESFDVNLLQDVIPSVNVEEAIETKCTNEIVQNEIKVEAKEHPTEKTVTKKKTKRTAPKRILITDDLQSKLSDEHEVIETPTQTTVLPLEEAKPKDTVEPPTPLEAQVTLDKKKKKKKKPATKMQSSSSSTTTLSNLDDSYDFLLETSILEDSDQKTNVEMSHAFDLMIEKGMFNNLEEKIKSLKISTLNEDDDSFFKSIRFGTFKTPAKATKQIFASPLFEKDFAAVTQPETKASTIFLENPTVNDIIKKSNNVEECDYPITKAVKNWLTKTRENTPDIELLKSPDTIYKQLNVEPEKVDQDEVTLWSAQTNGYHHIEEGEEAVEVYESKYGTNEDYLKIKAEIDEQQKTARNFPRHGNLPYRAICCNIM